MHREPKDEYGQDGEEPRKILHEVADDDGPRPEEMMEREEVENLDAGQEEAQGEQLVPEIDKRAVVVDVDDVEVAEQMKGHTPDPEE